MTAKENTEAQNAAKNLATAQAALAALESKAALEKQALQESEANLSAQLADALAAAQTAQSQLASAQAAQAAASQTSPPSPAQPAAPTANPDFGDFVSQNPFTIPAYDSKSMLSPEEVSSTITNLAGIVKISDTGENRQKLIATVCVILQSGGTSRKFEENKVFNPYNIPVTSKNVKTALTKVGTNLTPRKLARSLRPEIIQVASINNIPGNLSKKYILENPNYDSNDLIWASDFHSFTNDTAMPDTVRNWLQKNYNSRFNS